MLYRTKKEIGNYFGVCTQTITRWIKKEAFPACKLPNGEYVVTDHLIDQWLLTRNQVQFHDREDVS